MSRAKILVVEDEGIVALDLANRLRRLGYEVPAVAATGEQAIQQAEETRPELVLMDIRLGGDVDGIQAAQVIRARFGIQVIYLTALADDDTKKRAEETEPVSYILKPFTDDELQAAINAALGG